MQQQGRLLSDIYDSIHQGSVFAHDFGKKDGVYENPTDINEVLDGYIGRLRLDSIVSQKIILSDAQLLDGTFFLNAALSGRLDELPQERIEIRSRTTDPENAVLGFVRDKSESYLTRFEFSSLPHDQELRDRIIENLIKIPSKNVSNLKELRSALVQAGFDEVKADVLYEAWVKLVEFVRRGHKTGNISFIQWESYPRETWLQKLSEAFDSNSLKCIACLKSEHHVGGHAMQWILENLHEKRSIIAKELRKRRNDTEEYSDEWRDLNTVETCYNDAYNSVIAEQHDCDAKHPDELPGCWAFSIGQELYDKLFRPRDSEEKLTLPKHLTVRLPSDFVSTLGRIKPDVFARFRENHEGSINAWNKNRHNFDPLKRTANGLIDTLLNAGPFDARSTVSPRLCSPTRLFVTKHAEKAGPVLGTLLGAFAVSQLDVGTVAETLTPTITGIGGMIAGGPVGKKWDPNEYIVRQIVKHGKSLDA